MLCSADAFDDEEERKKERENFLMIRILDGSPYKVIRAETFDRPNCLSAGSAADVAMIVNHNANADDG